MQNQTKNKKNDICPYCKNRMTEIVRVMDDDKTPTQNVSYICENINCLLFIDYRKVRHWKKKKLVVYKEPPQRVNLIK